jgi:hypothetical protein
VLSRTPWTPKPERKPRYKLGRERQRALIANVVEMLRDGKPTVFQFSATYYHGIRSGLCLTGWPWIVADLTAAGVVDRALKRLGAKYPRWIEGQREYTAHEYPLYCANEECSNPIPRDAWKTTLYCSQACRKAAKDFRYKSQHREEDKARVMAARIAAREKGPTRICEQCGRPFKALDYTGKKPQRFCGLKCRSAFASSFAAGWRPRLLDKGRRGANGSYPTTPTRGNNSATERAKTPISIASLPRPEHRPESA